MNILRKL